MDAITQQMLRKTAKEALQELERSVDDLKDITKKERIEVEQHLEDASKEKSLWKDGYDADPVKALWGSGKASHPKLWREIIDDLLKNKVEIRYSEKNLTYGPHPSGGKPVITITEDASITALMHEAQHFYDDMVKGFPGYKETLYNPKVRWEMEFKAYMKEISFLRKEKQFDTAKKLLDNALEEKKAIESKFI